MGLSIFGMDTVMLAGALEVKLQAIADAGFAKVVLWGKDLVGHPQGIETAMRKVRESGLQISGFQLLQDFEGLSGRLLDYKLGLAQSMMKMMRALGARLLVVCSSASPHATGDMKKITEDLRLLATLATPLGIRIGYKALAWGRWINEYTAAWKVVERVDRENVGLVVDSFHILARGTPLKYLDDIPTKKIFLVQLSDALSQTDDIIETAQHQRVFPGEGAHNAAIIEIVRRLDKAGYCGDYAFEVFNDGYHQCSPAVIAAHARQSAQWLSEQVSGQQLGA